MNYTNAKDVLPPNLLAELQKYVTGALLYIPIPETSGKTAWGQLSGTREQLRQRNIAILREYQSGSSMAALAEKYYLSEESIRKIVYTKKVQMEAVV